MSNQKLQNFNLSDCSKIISQHTGLSANKVLSSLILVNQTILSQLVLDQKLEIRNFGSLKKKTIRPRKFTNPKTKVLSFLGETYTVYFKQSKNFLMINKSIIVAIDSTSLEETKAIISKLDPNKCMVKVGSVLFNTQGRPALDLVASAGFEIFFDIKFHDIPNTVSKSIKSFQGYPIKFFTVHLGGGKTMLRVSQEAAKFINAKCIGVSLLTSLTGKEVHTVFKRSIENTVFDMFKLAEDSGCDGVVCSPLELNLATKAIPNLIKITPGIRSHQNNTNDQVRTLSAKDALSQGASYLVIGRPITEAQNISEAFEEIYQSMYEQDND